MITFKSDYNDNIILYYNKYFIFPQIDIELINTSNIYS